MVSGKNEKCNCKESLLNKGYILSDIFEIENRTRKSSDLRRYRNTDFAITCQLSY